MGKLDNLSMEGRIMLGIIIVVFFAVVPVIYVKYMIVYCETVEDLAREKGTPCYDPEAFCSFHCEKNNDSFAGEIIRDRCICENGFYNNQIESYFTSSAHLLRNQTNIS